MINLKFLNIGRILYAIIILNKKFDEETYFYNIKFKPMTRYPIWNS